MLLTVENTTDEAQVQQEEAPPYYCPLCGCICEWGADADAWVCADCDEEWDIMDFEEYPC